MKELQSLLRQRGLPVSGRKAELIERLKNNKTNLQGRSCQHPQPLEDMSVKQLQNILREKKLPTSGRKAELIERLKTKPTNGPKQLEDMTVKQLQKILAEKGLPVSGTKTALIVRIKNGSKGGPKPPAWQHSDAKKDLKKSLLDPMSPIHKMSIEQIHESDERYQQYSLEKFAEYYKKLQQHVAEEKERVMSDDIAVARFLKNNPRSALNKRGYPHWDTHIAKKLLEVDVRNKLHEKMSPSILRKTRDAYKEFPANIFVKRVNREVTKQREARFWAYKRNKEGLRKWLEEIDRRAEEHTN